MVQVRSAWPYATFICRCRRSDNMYHSHYFVGEIRVRGSGLSCPVWRSYSKGEFRSIIGSSIIGIWAFLREMGLIERSERIVFSTILWSRTGNTCVRADVSTQAAISSPPTYPKFGGEGVAWLRSSLPGILKASCENVGRAPRYDVLSQICLPDGL